MAFVPVGVTVTFSASPESGGGFITLPATSVSANYGEAEVVDVTTVATPIGQKAFRITGDMKSYGSLSVTLNRPKGLSYAQLRGMSGTLSLTGPDWSLLYLVYATSVTETHETGGLAKSTINFTIHN